MNIPRRKHIDNGRATNGGKMFTQIVAKFVERHTGYWKGQMQTDKM